MEEYLHEGVWFQPLYERGVWGNEVSPQRNTAVRGFEPLISKVTTSRLNQLSHTTWEAIASTLSVGLFLGNETHHANSKREGCGGAQCPHRAPPPYKKVVKSP